MANTTKATGSERHDRWTAAIRARFLDELAASCNISQSARAVGRTERAAYSLRRRDPEFAAQCAEALQAGYARLEEELMARALGRNDADGGHARGFDPELAMKLIAHRDAIARGTRRMGAPARKLSVNELIDVLDKRLAAIARRRSR